MTPSLLVYRAIVCACAAAFAGCAAIPNSATQVAQTNKPTPAEAASKKAASKKPARPSLPAVELTEQLMLRLMTAEVAMQRGQPQVAVPALLELARETRDPRVAQRATEVAWNARYTDAAIEAASIWLQVAPDSARARQVLAALLASEQKLDAARSHFETWLATDKENVGQSFLQLSTLLSRNKDRAAVLALLRNLARPYPGIPEARLTVAQAAWNAGEQALALDEATAALKLRPDWELAALFRAQALQRRSSDEALAFLKGFVQAQPDAKDARLNYARLLVAAKRYDEAREEFGTLTAQFPQNADVSMAVALLAMQANDYDSAEAQLRRALDAGYGEPDVVRLYLGQVAEERKQYDQALKWYAAVGAGDQYVGAQSRYAGVLARQGKLDAARKHLQTVKAQNTQQRVQLTQAEAQLLREANAHKEAFELLGRALSEMPDAPDLLYDHAMAAEKMDRLDILESNLRKLIKIRPDHAHAYNALGYTLADRNQRLPEARELIEQALKLSPEDAFIMDSMGWVLFRMGLRREAIDYLQKAHNLRPDAEIAAHFGEVLWADGQQAQALKIWSEALKSHRDNEALRDTVKRYAPTIVPVSR